MLGDRFFSEYAIQPFQQFAFQALIHGYITPRSKYTIY